jgi:hypothetical protein
MRIQLTERELRGYAEQGLRYEFDTLQAAVRAVQAAAPSSHELHIALESALVHVRNLVEFFNTTNSRDVNVRDFLGSDDEGRAWRHSKPKDASVRTELARQISVWLSHFSRDRRGSNPGWDIVGYTRSLLRLLAAFIHSLRPSRQAWFAWTDKQLTFDDTSIGVYTTTVTTSSTMVVPLPTPHGVSKILRDSAAVAIPDPD